MKKTHVPTERGHLSRLERWCTRLQTFPVAAGCHKPPIQQNNNLRLLLAQLVILWTHNHPFSLNQLGLGVNWFNYCFYVSQSKENQSMWQFFRDKEMEGKRALKI